MSAVWLPFTKLEVDNIEVPTIQRGEGSYIYDEQENKYLNCFSGLSLILGIGDDDINNAIYKQLKTLPYNSLFRSYNKPVINLSDKLIELTGHHYDKVIYSNSGSEAVEAAIKLVKKYWQYKNQNRYKLISLDSSYHGNSLGVIPISGIYSETSNEFKDNNQATVCFSNSPTCYRCKYDKNPSNCNLECAENIEEIIQTEDSNTIAAVILEPILGAGGVAIPPDRYFAKVSKICQKYSIPLILDESATGFGRTGEMFAFNYLQIIPDILILAKGISSGYLPLGATLVKDYFFKTFLENENALLTHGSSQAGNSISCAASIATINKITKLKIPQNAKSMGELLFKKCKKLLNYPQVGDIRGRGLMLCIEFVDDKASKAPLSDSQTQNIYSRLLSNGVFAHVKNNRIGIFPPLIITKDQINHIYEALNNSIQTAQGGYSYVN